MVPRLLTGITLVVAALLAPPSVPSARQKPFPPPKSLGKVETYGRNIQRAMTLLATSTPRKRNTVRVLFYGQSITEQPWWKQVADDLRRRFPHADLRVENRAIGGFAAQLLVKTAETDLYPFYPDLVIFHVYGDHREYENILRRLRERTTAEVLQQTDHVTRDEDLKEETDAALLSPKSWNAWMNHALLPSVARNYQTELVDQRELWKAYLTDHQLPAKALLRDGVHLNDHGCYLMAEIVKAYLRHDPGLPDTGWKEWVKTCRVGEDVQVRDGQLELDFVGNRVDVILPTGDVAPASVRIDGNKPSEFPELYALTRTTAYPGSKWPCLLRVQRENPLLLEDWTLTLSDVSEDLKRFRFRVEGSRTGPDGEGESGQRFVSRSGRVVIDPADWNFGYALRVFKKPLPPDFRIRWSVLPQFLDEIRQAPQAEPGVERVVTVAQGLPNTRHRLTLEAPPGAVVAVRVYRPPYPPPESR